MDFILPKHFQKLKNTEGDAPGVSFYGFEDAQHRAFIKIEPTFDDACMPLDNKMVIDGFHNGKDETSGLIKVQSGKTGKGIDYAFFIIKSREQKDGHPSVLYYSSFDFVNGDNSYEFQMYFEENGITGVRDSMIFAKSRLSGFDGWMRDPYESNYKVGFLMNLSEDEKYDKLFPNHPLSQLRKVIQFIIKNN